MYTAISRFQLDSVHDTLACTLMQFTKPEIDIILPLFWFDCIKYHARFQATLEEALGVVLLCLAWPVRYLSLMDQFGHSRTWLCIVYVDTCKYLARRYQFLLAWDDKSYITILYEDMQTPFRLSVVDFVSGDGLMVPYKTPADLEIY